MEKIDALNQVAEFHKTFNAPILEKPQIPSKERCELRVSLLQEELNELQQAIADNDLVEIADALCDLQYVLSGAVLEFGLGEKFPALFNEVQRSNMSKACSNQQEADETIAFYKEKGEEAFSEKSGDKINVHRKSDHKVLKNKYYSPADLKTILDR
ncbi:MAG TPA: nucleoside triphosphate pyrophosphohydrolase family protein [Kaistella chaponensis]|jgi:predicted HAD superfamily Cof-like phosphohydrolase|uniref:nucleoside triphosphate pyrophosphohydrolase family protein n=1 Tax=Kaistella chaponensis TaxID=713588 RepID=UPI002C875563|nr:nucleoside triphosphate pyrophosphohydrolase family protein [Kaistella chaponensis]HPW88680.1 nucleoside triphosphate pyrophosphohydrolase family protein [Kaistella chaponensis]